MKPIPIGSDFVSRDGDRIVVDAARDMPDWEVRKARRAQIRFRDRAYFVTERRPVAKGRVRYLLEPWPERSVDVPGIRLVYDREYVAERDSAAGLAVAGASLVPLLVVLSPWIGFLPSRTKRRIHAQLGVHPITATRRSVILEGVVGLLAGTYLCIDGFAAIAGSLYGGGGLGAGPLQLPAASLLVVPVLSADIVARLSGLLRGDLDQDGAYEWLYRPLLRLIRRSPPRSP